MAHSVSTWQTDGTSFKEASLSKISSNLRESIILWLDEHNDEQRRKMIETVFEALEKSGIKDTNDFFNIKKSFNIVKNIRNVDEIKNNKLKFYRVKNINFARKFYFIYSKKKAFSPLENKFLSSLCEYFDIKREID